MNKKRVFSAYDLNQLRKFGPSNVDLNRLGEKPVEYITGHAEFCGLDFLVTPDVLIPRIESEQIIDLSFDFLTSLADSKYVIADVGSGSGCLGISLADKLLKNRHPKFDIYFSDLSLAALHVSKSNSTRLLPGQNKKTHFIESDLLEKYPRNLRFDLIIANLPYIPSSRKSALPKSVREYEPESSLFGGNDGTEIINRLLSQITPFLKPVFQIILEIDTHQTLSVFRIPDELNANIINDIFERPRFLIISSKR